MNPTIDITKLKLSELLRLAVKDARAAEAAGCILDMDEWVLLKADGCHVCMAGAVMLQTLGYGQQSGKQGTLIWSVEDGQTSAALVAIDQMRIGWFIKGFRSIAGVTADKIAKRDTEILEAAAVRVRNAYDRILLRAPWETYLEAADILEAGGL